MMYYQMKKNSTVNRNLTHVTITEVIPLDVYELTKSHIKIIFLQHQ